MTRYLVTDTEIQAAIHNAIKTQDTNPGGYDYVITSSMNVVKDVLKRLDKFKVAESEQTENSKQNDGRETDTNDYPVVDLEQDNEDSKVFVIDDLEKLATRIIDKLDEYSTLQTLAEPQITVCNEELVEMICTAYQKGREY